MSLKRRLFIAFAFIMIMIGIFGIYMSSTIRYMNRMNKANDQIVDIQSEVNKIEISKLKYVSTARREDAQDVFYHRGSLIESIELIKGAYISEEQDDVFDIILEEVKIYEEEFQNLISITDQMLALKISIESDMKKLSKNVEAFDNRIYEDADQIIWSLRKQLIILYSDYFSVNNMMSDAYHDSWKGLDEIIVEASQIKELDALPMEYQVKGLRIESILKKLNENMEKLVDKRDELEKASRSLSLVIEGINIDVGSVLDMQQIRIEEERSALVTAFNVTLGLMILLYIAINYYLSNYINQNMNEIIEVTSRISAGDYGMRIHNDRTDEFGILGRVINKMAQSLLTSTTELLKTNSDLEGLVEQRTVELNKANMELEKANKALSQEKERLAKLAWTDALTGLMNRRAILDFIEDQIVVSNRYDRVFTVMITDLDLFKRINDNYGHAAGDEVLKKISAVFLDTIRETDRVGRFGGEEFLFVFPETDEENSKKIIERIKRNVENIAYSFDDVVVTISGGVSEYNGESSTMIISSADNKLYKAKESGRNRICY